MSTYSLTIQKQDVAEDLGVGETTTLVNNITDTNVLTDVFGAAYEDTTTAEFSFDRGISRQTKINVLTSTFGDGYSQRVRTGINPKMEKFGVTFKHRTNEETKVLAAFFDNKSADNFDIVLNGDTIKVTAEEYEINYAHDNTHTIRTTLNRVYEP